jgi:hypothetical protein
LPDKFDWRQCVLEEDTVEELDGFFYAFLCRDDAAALPLKFGSELFSIEALKFSQGVFLIYKPLRLLAD